MSDTKEVQTKVDSKSNSFGKKKQQKAKPTKQVYGADFKRKEDEQEQRPQKSHNQGQNQRQPKKQRSFPQQQHQGYDQNSTMITYVSNNLYFIFNEDALSKGCFIRKFMDENGFIKVDVLRELLNVPDNDLIIKGCQQVDKLKLNDDETGVGLKEGTDIWVEEESKRITDLKTIKLDKYRMKVFKLVNNGIQDYNSRKPF
ncbi:hypothetical protein QTN25_009567 [Entamoeba marina]